MKRVEKTTTFLSAGRKYGVSVFSKNIRKQATHIRLR